jgi:hypothetical protein
LSERSFCKTNFRYLSKAVILSTKWLTMKNMAQLILFLFLLLPSFHTCTHCYCYMGIQHGQCRWFEWNAIFELRYPQYCYKG